jgi:hypothetical protein
MPHASLVARESKGAWVVYEGLREDKPAAEVRREVPRSKPGAAK